MTRSQEQAISKIERMVRKEGAAMFREYEIKEWEVHENEYFVSLIFEIGNKGDEGTLAQYICRDRAQLFIGPKGGIRYPMTKNGKYIERRFEGYSILQAVCDQRIR